MSAECELCGREFDSERGLSIHQTTGHADDKPYTDADGRGGSHSQFECAECGFERSIRRKGSRIRYPCPECGQVQTFNRVGRVTAD